MILLSFDLRALLEHWSVENKSIAMVHHKKGYMGCQKFYSLLPFDDQSYQSFCGIWLKQIQSYNSCWYLLCQHISCVRSFYKLLGSEYSAMLISTVAGITRHCPTIDMLTAATLYLNTADLFPSISKCVRYNSHTRWTCQTLISI